MYTCSPRHRAGLWSSRSLRGASPGCRTGEVFASPTPRSRTLKAAAAVVLPPILQSRAHGATDISETVWLDAVERKKRLLKAEQASLQRLEAETDAEEAARNQAREEVKRRRALERESRMKAIVAEKEAQRRNEAKQVISHSYAGVDSWETAVAQKKAEERERRRMQNEESLTREQLDFADRTATALQAAALMDLHKIAAELAAVARERNAMQLSDREAFLWQEKEREETERTKMEFADEESRSAAALAAAEAWSQQVHQAKIKVRQERLTREREQEAMILEDSVSRNWNKELQKIEADAAKKRAAAEAAARRASDEAKRLLRQKQAEEQERETVGRELDRNRMQAADEASKMRESWNRSEEQRLEWEMAVASKKKHVRERRVQESRETQCMQLEDRLASKVQHQEKLLQEEMERADQAAKDHAAAAAQRALYLAEAWWSCAAGVLQAESMQRLREAHHVAAEFELARTEEKAAREHQAQAVEAQHQQEECARESASMAKEDRRSRCHENALQRLGRQEEQWFSARKTEHRCLARQQIQLRADNERRRLEEAQSRRRIKSEAMAEEKAAEDRKRQEAALAEERKQQQAALAAEKKIQQEQRQREAIYNEDCRLFEDLYRRNRHKVAEVRRLERDATLPDEALRAGSTSNFAADGVAGECSKQPSTKDGLPGTGAATPPMAEVSVNDEPPSLDGTLDGTRVLALARALSAHARGSTDGINEGQTFFTEG